jgi:hypothetical protein
LTLSGPEEHRLIGHHQRDNEPDHHNRRQNHLITITKSARIRIMITTIKGSLLIIMIMMLIIIIMIIVATVALEDARFTESCCSLVRAK